jgi:hypothetical protein
MDYGTGCNIQCALAWAVPDTGADFPNPTEAGGEGNYTISYSDPMPVSEFWRGMHGSPIVSLYNDSNNPYDPSHKTTHQCSRCIPLNFDNTYGSSTLGWSTGPDQARIWNTLRMGKDLYLNFNGHPTVTKYVGYLYTPEAITDRTSLQFVDVCRGNFKYFWYYDATTDTMTQQNIPYGTFLDYPSSTYGGVICADGTGNNARAMGLYTVDYTVGGTTCQMGINNYCNAGTGQYNFSGTTLGCYHAGSLGAGFPAGQNTMSMWIITDTRANVRTLMRTLYLEGWKQ